MGIELANERGSLGQFASNRGYSDLIEASQSIPTLKKFFDDASTEDVPAVESALEEIKSPPDVATTAKQLAALMHDQELVFITNGTYDGDDDEDTEKQDFDFTGQVVKLDSDHHLVFGWFSIVEINGKELTDTQGDIISPETIEFSAYDYVLYARKGGDMHNHGKDGETLGIGRLVESCVFTYEKQTAMLKSLHDQGITDAVLDLRCVGWWGGFRVDDDSVWDRIQSGELKAFSIGGKGKRDPRPDLDFEKGWVTIDDHHILFGEDGTVLSKPQPQRSKPKPQPQPQPQPSVGEKKTADQVIREMSQTDSVEGRREKVFAENPSKLEISYDKEAAEEMFDSEAIVQRWTDTVDKGIDVFKKLVGPLADGMSPVHISPIRAGSRAGADANSSRIYIDSISSFNTVAHELGHQLERQNPKILDAAVAFVNRRTAGESEVSLNGLTSLGTYGSNETTKPDKFPDPYVGKVYKSSTGKIVATEVISMGMQYLAQNPLGFAKKDRDYFNFMHDVLRGKK